MAAADGRSETARSELEKISTEVFRAPDATLAEALGGFFEEYGSFDFDGRPCVDTLRSGTFSLSVLRTAATFTWAHGNRNAPMFLGNYLDTYRHR